VGGVGGCVAPNKRKQFTAMGIPESTKEKGDSQATNSFLISNINRIRGLITPKRIPLS
jgi:hypothetical protein